MHRERLLLYVPEVGLCPRQQPVSSFLLFVRHDRVELSLPLRPANPHNGDPRDYGAMEVAITYTDDYVGQG